MSDDFTCSKCGEEFIGYTRTPGLANSPVSEKEAFDCPNGHQGVINYTHDGHISQSWGIRFPDQHELAR